ncbi:MAG: thioredoxin family protein [Anaerolineales bacterium]|nr:thioredoxin family protein [Anaerolineales bacterium]
MLAERLLTTLLVATLLWIGFVLYQRYHARHIKQQLAHEESAARPRILFFHGSHCGACRQQDAYLGQLDAQWLPLIEAVDVAHQPELVAKYSVMTIPMTVLIASDQTVQQINYGLTDTQKLRTQLQGMIPS